MAVNEERCIGPEEMQERIDRYTKERGYELIYRRGNRSAKLTRPDGNTIHLFVQSPNKEPITSPQSHVVHTADELCDSPIKLEGRIRHYESQGFELIYKFWGSRAASLRHADGRTIVLGVARPASHKEAPKSPKMSRAAAREAETKAALARSETTVRRYSKKDFEQNVSVLLRQGYSVQSNDGKRAVLYKQPGYGHPLVHILMLFLLPIIGNLLVIMFARGGLGHSVTVELREPEA